MRTGVVLVKIFPDADKPIWRGGGRLGTMGEQAEQRFGSGRVEIACFALYLATT